MKVRVVVPARNEARSLPTMLRSVHTAIAYARQQQQAWAADLEVVVVANGCSDDTADVARAEGARVLEHDLAGKVEALRVGMAGAEIAVCIDADVVVGPRTVHDTVTALVSSSSALAVCPPLAVPALRWPATPLAWALHRYNAHRGFSSERLWLSGRFYAVRNMEFPTINDMRDRGHDGPLLVDDVWLSRHLLARAGAAAIVHIDTDPVVFRPPATLRGMSRTWRRLRRALRQCDTLFPELPSPGRDRRIELRSIGDRLAMTIFSVALWCCRLHALIAVEDGPDAWPTVPESKA